MKTLTTRCGPHCGRRMPFFATVIAANLLIVFGSYARAEPIASGYLWHGDEPKIISTFEPFTKTTTQFPFSGYVETKANLALIGDWQFRLMTSSEVTNVVISGGELIEASAQISGSRTGQLGANQAPFPSYTTHTGYLDATVTVGTNSFHDGALNFGSIVINSLGDLFFPDAGEYVIHMPLSVTVPVSATGSFPVNMLIRSESWGRVGMTFGDFSHTFALTSILLPNGNTPESEGWTLSFDDGAISPNVPEPSTLVLLVVGATSYVVSRVSRITRSSKR